jgi:hypothetical protein
MKQWLKVLCAVLVMGMLLSMIPAAVQATEEETETETVDFMLVVDASRSLFKSDPKRMAIAACKMFIDMIPFENARVGVIVFGYKDSQAYVYQGSYGTVTDRNRVRQIVPLQNAVTLDSKDEIKLQVESYIDTKHKSNADTLTPMGAAMLAAVDSLKANNAAPGDACVILLTDGRMAFSSGVHERQSVENALDVAVENEWPVYSIELDYDNQNDEWENDWAARPLLNRIAKETGGSREEISSASDISDAFLKIFNRFMFGDSGTVHSMKADENGIVEHTVEVPNLTSETTIVVSGSNISKIEVVNPQGTSREIKGDVDETNIIASVEPGKYACMKLVCPAPGTWTIRAYGDPNATIGMYDCSMKDVDLTLVTEPVTNVEAPLMKNDKVAFSSFFTYRGIPILTNDFYNQKQPVIEITNLDTGRMYEFAMGANDNGYILDMLMNDVGSGRFSARIRLNDEMFRNGRKFSNYVEFSVENVLPELIRDTIEPVEGYVNDKFPTIDLAQYVKNADGDELTYELLCTSNRDLKFTYTINENGYLDISCGIVPGTHALELTVKDPDMKDPLVLPLEAKVENRLPVVESKKAELLIEPLPLVQTLNDVYELDINAAFTDPDGLTLECVQISTNKEGIVNATTDGSVIRIQALEAGNVEVTYLVSDQVTEVLGTVKIRVVSGFAEFMAENWWKILAIVVALLIFIILMISKAKGTRVKGFWTISAQINGIDYPMDEAPSPVNFEWSSYGKDSKFNLTTMLRDQLPRIILDENKTRWGDFFAESSAQSKIVMKGVWLGSGCVLANVPGKKTGFTAKYQSKEASGNIRMNNGTVTLTIENGGDTMVLNIKHSTRKK